MPKPEQLKLSDKLWRHSRNLYDRKLEWKEREKVQQCHHNRSKGSARLRRSTSLSRSKARTTSGETGLEFFAVGLDGFFGGALADIYEHVEGHRNDSATILDLALTSLRFDAG